MSVPFQAQPPPQNWPQGPHPGSCAQPISACEKGFGWNSLSHQRMREGPCCPRSVHVAHGCPEAQHYRRHLRDRDRDDQCAYAHDKAELRELREDQAAWRRRRDKRPLESDNRTAGPPDQCISSSDDPLAQEGGRSPRRFMQHGGNSFHPNACPWSPDQARQARQPRLAKLPTISRQGLLEVLPCTQAPRVRLRSRHSLSRRRSPINACCPQMRQIRCNRHCQDGCYDRIYSPTPCGWSCFGIHVDNVAHQRVRKAMSRPRRPRPLCPFRGVAVVPSTISQLGKALVHPAMCAKPLSHGRPLRPCREARSQVAAPVRCPLASASQVPRALLQFRAPYHWQSQQLASRPRPRSADRAVRWPSARPGVSPRLEQAEKARAEKSDQCMLPTEAWSDIHDAISKFNYHLQVSKVELLSMAMKFEEMDQDEHATLKNIIKDESVRR